MEYTLTEATLLFNDSFKRWTYGDNWSTTPEIEKYNLHKLRHSIGVLEIWRLILLGKEFQNISNELKRKSEICFLLHDLWRFYQNDWENTLNNEEFEHGDESAKIVAKQGYWKEIILAIKYHNKRDFNKLYDENDFINMNKEEQKETIFLTRILRDADKLQNLLYIIFAFDSLYKLDYNNYKWKGITTEILNEFLALKAVDNRKRKTKADYLLSMVARWFDLEFISTYNILIQNDFFNFILEKLETEFWIDQFTIMQIEESINKIVDLIRNKNNLK